MEEKNMKKALERINKQAKAYQGRTVTRTELPREIVQNLKDNFDRLGVWEIPISELNEILGFKSDKPRAWSLNRNLNANFSDLIEPDEIWKIGTANKNSVYKINIVVRETETTSKKATVEEKVKETEGD